jgi:hypothetical protein
MYQNIVETDSTMYIFDDFHALLGCLFGNGRYLKGHLCKYCA